MKKITVYAVIVLSIGLLWIGCAGSEQEECTSIPGNYNVSKILTGFACAKGGADVTINNDDTAFPAASTLAITQLSCSLVASESVLFAGAVNIPYLGSANEDDEFTLNINTSSAPPIPLTLDVGAFGELSCEFTASITWNGNDNGSGHLSGSIANTLTLVVAGSNANCPDTCAVTQSFTASKL